METMIPWFVLLCVFVTMALLQWRVINALDEALSRTAPLPPVPIPLPRQAVAPAPATAPIKTQPWPVPPAPRPASVPVPKPLPTPAPAPKLTGPFAGAPHWFLNALHEIGFKETGNNQGIGRYINMAHTGAEGDPWCAIFANAMLEEAGIPGTRSASSQSFRSSPNFVQLASPALGALCIFWRGSGPNSGIGHVGFYRGENISSIWTLGGNENDMVQIEALPRSSSTFGLIGYWWPKSVPLPTTGPIQMPAGSPIHVQTDPTTGQPIVPAVVAPSSANGVQTNITATMFGSLDSGKYQASAYGGPIIDTQPGVALPFRFTGVRPKVKVTGVKSGNSVVCDIVDIGPWNIDDPYWTTGSRPQAESGTDLGQVSAPRRTNGAGIDLTSAAAEAVQIDGKGLVNWEFVANGPSTPNVV